MAMGDAGDFTVGVEEEYQLVSAATGELTSRARHVLAADWAGEIEAEAMETMVEVGTHVCRDCRELGTELRRLRLQVASTAATEELGMVAAAIHPFSAWEPQLMTLGKRYDVLRERFARVVRTEHVFGMHVHVAIPAGLDRMPILRTARWFTPHLLALSCSSPIFEGADTGFSSYRNILWRRLPLTGPCPAIESEDAYRGYTGALVRSGAALDAGTVYWSIRPHPTYPTIEYRVSDVCPRVEDAVAIAALARSLTIAIMERRITARGTGLGDGADVAVISANDWSVARYGLDARIMDPGAPGGAESIRDSIRRLVATVAPIAAERGDADALAGVERILERGNAADRMREVVLRSPGMRELVSWLEGESLLGVGIDRRLEQRDREEEAEPAGRREEVV